jgi:exodeoxyribonuclease-3
MRIISWNCLSGFHRKWPALFTLKPDIAVIQEVTQKGLLEYLSGTFGSRVEWFGEPGSKGIAVVATKGWAMRRLNYPDGGKSLFLPVELRKARHRLDLIAVWTKAVKNSHENSYIGQAYDYFTANRKMINTKTIIVGDFNANSIWDKNCRRKTFTAVKDFLKDLGQESAYHHYFDERFGKESQSTFYLQKNLKKGYHIDYCFVSRYWRRKLNSVKIHKSGHWGRLTHSDHRPLAIDFAIK